MEHESALIAAAGQSDLKAFNQLVLHYQGLAYNVAYQILGDADIAADATQDSFLKAYRALGRFTGGSFKAWLLRIVTNTCYDQLRYRRRHPKHPLDELDEVEWAPWLTDRAEQPGEYAERQELRQAIWSGLRALPEDQRTALVLCDLEGFTYEEIAQSTATNVGTVKSRLSRARAKMRDYLLGQPELLPQQFARSGVKRRAGDVGS